MIGYINKIESMGLVDGTGIRTVIFMQGCNLRCIFCHNPESWNKNINEKYTPIELVNKIKRFKPYYGSDGGVTFSGGEPLVQTEFLIETCKLLKEEGINICLDTAGVGCTNYEILDYVDLIILDIKHITKEGYKYITGLELDEFNTFLSEVIKRNKKIWLRQVNDSIEYINKLKEYTKDIPNVLKKELLPYHTMGISKYKDLNIPYRLLNVDSMDKIKCEELEKIWNS